MKSIDGKYLKGAAVIWGICFIFFVLVFMFVLRPQSKRLTVIETEANQKKLEVDAAREAAEEKTREKLNEQIENLRAQLGNFVIDSEDIQDVGGQIRNIFVNVGLNLTLNSFSMDLQSSRSIGTFSDCKYVYGHPISVNFTASFNQFATFLNDLEKNKSVIFIDTFSINKSDKGSSHKVNMQLAVLVKRAEQIKESEG